MADGFPDELLMEHFSDAYVRAIASAAGFSVQHIDDDFDSVDREIVARGFIEYQGARSKNRSPRLGIQLKCTYAHKPNGDHLSFPLPVKNYDDLRDESNALPRILVVVCVPETRPQRLIWSPDELRLLRCAFWTSLRGAAETKNTSTVTVKLHAHFSPDELRRLMYLVAEEELL